MNLDDIWTNDTLGRRDDAEYIIRFLLARLTERAAAGQTKSYVLNVDAEWGMGKTFFLRGMADQLALEGHIVASVNAWQDDHAEDPLLSVMAAIEDVLKPRMAKQPLLQKTIANLKANAGGIVAAAAKGAVKAIGRKILAEGAAEIVELLETSNLNGGPLSAVGLGETAIIESASATATHIETLVDRQAADQIANFRQVQQSIVNFRANLQQLTTDLAAADVPLPIFVLVDELDRCRPPYAIALLERTKHLFSIDNVVFVVATATEQLAHSIGVVYGKDFESKRYLNRFFDRTYRFDEPRLERFVTALLESRPLDTTKLSTHPKFSTIQLMVNAYESLGVIPRDIEQIHDLLRTVVTNWGSKAKIEITAMLPLIIAFHGGHFAEWNDQTVDYFRSKSRPVGPLTWQYVAGTKTKREAVNAEQMFERWKSRIGESLPDIMRTSPTGFMDDWVREGFNAEFSVLHNNSHNPEKPPVSIMQSYPGLIRKAGRFSIF